MTSARKALLLSILGLLILVRFVLMPILEWQQAQHTSNFALAERNARAAHKLTDTNRTDRITQLETQIEQLAHRIPEAPNDLDIQVTTNQILDSTLREHSLDETSRAWTFHDRDPKLAEVRISLSGHFYDIVAWSHTLEAPPNYIQFAEVDLRKNNNTREGTIQASFVLRQYFTLPVDQEGELQ